MPRRERKAYHREYYLKNKERLKQKKYVNIHRNRRRRKYKRKKAEIPFSLTITRGCFPWKNIFKTMGEEFWITF
jgi:hypothetical protein